MQSDVNGKRYNERNGDLRQSSPRNLLDMVPTPKFCRPSATVNYLLFLDVPRFSTEFGKRSFSYLAPTVWNGLAFNIGLSPTFDTFKRRLKTHLFN